MRLSKEGCNVSQQRPLRPGRLGVPLSVRWIRPIVNGVGRIGLVLGALVLVSGGVGTVSPAVADSGGDEPQVAYSRSEPVIIFNDGKDEMSLEARVTGSVSRVEARHRYGDGMIQIDGQDVDSFERFELTRVENDIYSRAGITSEHPPDRARFDIIVTDEDGEEHVSLRVDSWFMVTDKRSKRRIFAVDDNIRMTTNLVNIRADNELFDVRPSTDETAPPDFQQVGQVLYEHFPDEFDFMAVFATTSGGAFNFYIDAKNTIEGIGKSIFDNTASYGSAGRLQGVAYLDISTGAPIMHELTHNFGVFFDSGLGLDDGTPHWGGVDIPGTLGGLDFKRQDDDQYRITWSPFDIESDFLPMAPMELYLWGLMPPEDVPDVTVLDGIDPREQEVDDLVVPDDVSTVSMADIQAVHGPRVPPAGISGAFSLAGVVVSSGRWASDAEMAFWSGVMEKFGAEQGTATVLDTFDRGLVEEFDRPGTTATFDFWTSGRGEMDTTLAGEAHDLPGLTGAWFDPDRPGQGFNLQMAPSGLFGYYYGYDDQGNDLWLSIDIIEEPLEFGRSFSAEVFSGASGVFGDPGDVSSWGEVTFRFDSCHDGHAELADHSGQMIQVFDLSPLALVHGASMDDCRILPEEDIGPVALNAAWYDPATSGQGWNLIYSSAGLMGYFYGYTADGEPLWLVTEDVIADVELGESVEFSLLSNQSEGATFDAPADPATLETWGEVTLTFDDCRSGTADIQGLDGTQIQDIEVLAQALAMPACE